MTLPTVIAASVPLTCAHKAIIEFRPGLHSKGYEKATSKDTNILAMEVVGVSTADVVMLRTNKIQDHNVHTISLHIHIQYIMTYLGS